MHWISAQCMISFSIVSLHTAGKDLSEQVSHANQTLAAFACCFKLTSRQR